jgi:threonine/homoserine/homoserine lactone efflux protein
MDTFAFLSLLAAASLNAVVPGPGMMLALGRSAAHGMAAGIQVSLGMALATLIVIALVWAVMAGLLSLTDRGLTVLRVVGLGVIGVLALMLLVGPGAEAVAGPSLRAAGLARAGSVIWGAVWRRV